MRRVFKSSWKRGEGTPARFFATYPAGNAPFRPIERRAVPYRVRAADCDMYHVLFHPKVQDILEVVSLRADCVAFYGNIRTSARPLDELVAHLFVDASGSSPGR